MALTNMSAASSEHSDATTTSGKVKRAPSSASSTSSCNNNSNSNSTNNSNKGRRRQRGTCSGVWCCGRYHLNSVWSIWYCLVTLGFMAYLVMGGVKRFLAYAALPWPKDEQPYVELNAYVGLVGASVVLAPFYLLTSFLKVGNLANDGYKLGASLTTCTRDPPPVPLHAPGLVRNLWLHGVPTAPFLHLVAAFCLLLPRTLMQATLISSGFLPRDEIWKTDLDFLVPHNDRLIVLASLNATTDASITTPDAMPRPSPLRSPDAVTDAPVPPTHAPQKTATVRSKHKQEAGKVSYVVPGGKMSYGTSREQMHGGEAAGKGVYVVPDGGTQESPPPSGKTFARTHLPEVGDWSPLSPELLNYTIALLVFAIRYPSVFWHTNKGFGLLFSLQLIVNGIHTILIITAFTILYKLHVCGGGQELRGGESFLLNLPATVGLLLVAVMLVTVSSSALYLYGYQKFAQFVVHSRQRYHITFDTEPGVVGSYVPPCAALVVLVGLGVTHGPLLWDLSLVYRGSLDAVVLAAVIGTIVHLFLWVVLWLFLTIKAKWTFKLRVTVARVCVSSARSIKLVNDVELMSSEGPQEGQAAAPLLVVGAGKAYAITDAAPKKTIMGVVQKSHQEKRARGQEEEIYWLRPSKPIHTQAKTMSPRTKVTFDEGNLLTSPSRKGRVRGRERPQEPTYRRVTTLSDSDDEAGDYALLRETVEEPGAPAPHPPDPRYVDRQQILAYRRAMEERLASQQGPHTTSGPDYEEADHLHMRSPQAMHHLDAQGPMTPRSTRSNDSGVVPEERSQRSDSVSTSSSNTPPENSEESGIHSGATDLARHRSNSVDDLTQLPPDPNLLPTSPKAMSLQRPPVTSSPSSPYGYTPGRTLSPGPGGLVYPAAESTVVIRRQRSITQEIKPPVDPIYGSRPLTSFTDQQQQQQEARREAAQDDLLAVAQNSFNSSQSTHSSGYHSGSANPSSGSNSSRNSPVPQHPGPSISPAHHSVLTHKNQCVYGQLSRPGTKVGQHSPQGVYGRTTGPQRLPQAPQIPLPPIPQGHQSSLQDLYGRTTGQKIYGHIGELGGTCGPGLARHPVGRSASLRATSGAVAKYNTPLGHGQPSQGSSYNTNV